VDLVLPGSQSDRRSDSNLAAGIAGLAGSLALLELSSKRIEDSVAKTADNSITQIDVKSIVDALNAKLQDGFGQLILEGLVNVLGPMENTLQSIDTTNGHVDTSTQHLDANIDSFVKRRFNGPRMIHSGLQAGTLTALGTGYVSMFFLEDSLVAPYPPLVEVFFTDDTDAAVVWPLGAAITATYGITLGGELYSTAPSSLGAGQLKLYSLNRHVYVLSLPDVYWPVIAEEADNSKEPFSVRIDAIGGPASGSIHMALIEPLDTQ